MTTTPLTKTVKIRALSYILKQKILRLRLVSLEVPLSHGGVILAEPLGSLIGLHQNSLLQSQNKLGQQSLSQLVSNFLREPFQNYNSWKLRWP